MNVCKTEQEYLDQIIEPVRRCCKRYGYLPSVLIAQSCLENGYGIPSYWDNPQIQALIAVENGVGIKRELLNKSWVDIGLSVWQGGYIRKDTPEQYGQQIVTVKDDFRVYDCMERSFADYLCFMTWGSNYGPGGEPKYGQKVLSIKDPETLIKKVSSLGYATGQTYPTSVMRIVNKHNLTQYDDLTGVEPTACYPGEAPQPQPQPETITINPNPNFEPSHNTSARSGAIEFIYIHYVGALGGAKANIDYYNQRSTTKASADFYVDFDGSIWQYNMDLKGRYCWAVGGGRQSQYGGQYYGIAKNANGISIEMCVRSKTGKAPANPNDPNWYFEQATIDGAVKLAKYLMKQFGISADHVIRHYDVNGKFCPGVVGWNEASGDASAWQAFKARLTGDTPTPQPTPTPTGKMFRVQVGAYKRKGNASNRAAYVYEVTQYANIKAYKQRKQKVQEGWRCFIEQNSDGMYCVYCGSFSVKTNADKRSTDLSYLYEISNFIKEV